MRRLRVHAEGAKHLRICGMDLFLALCLQELPEILAQRDHPSAQGRLFPAPIPTDPKAAVEWHQLMTPELRHLFVTAGETVARDLTGLDAEEGQPGGFQVTIPAEHLAAWMSAINQARLIFGELYAIEECDMHNVDMDEQSPKLPAVMKIEWLGMLLHRFVEFQLGESGPDGGGDAGSPKPEPRKRGPAQRRKKPPAP